MDKLIFELDEMYNDVPLELIEKLKKALPDGAIITIKRKL